MRDESLKQSTVKERKGRVENTDNPKNIRSGKYLDEISEGKRDSNDDSGDLGNRSRYKQAN